VVGAQFGCADGRHRRVRQDARQFRTGRLGGRRGHDAVGHAKRIADYYGIAVVLVHHVRKSLTGWCEPRERSTEKTQKIVQVVRKWCAAPESV
jgi:phosphoribosyl 1,2-cyclic phosphodiesterase